MRKITTMFYQNKNDDVTIVDYDHRGSTFYKITGLENVIDQINLKEYLWGPNLYFWKDGPNFGVAAEVRNEQIYLEFVHKSLSELTLKRSKELLNMINSKMHARKCTIKRSNGEAVKKGNFVAVGISLIKKSC